MAQKPIVFRYKPLRGQRAPIITMGVRLQGEWFPIEVYVDTGAAYTVLHSSIADGLGFDYRGGNRIFLQVGDGSFIPVYLHELEIQLGEERFTAEVGFSERLGVGFNLLGRRSIFPRFRVCFDESQGVITFEPRTGAGGKPP